jgi:superfamily I DNA and/or RNA helicase
MICELVRLGKKVGIVANSHAVIRNLVDKVRESAAEQGLDLTCIQKPKETEPAGDRLRIARSNDDLLHGLASDCHVGAGTAWLWSTPAAFEAVDVLFVDEAAQMSLANVLAVSQSAKAVVLLGDPQQLDQPTQGTHPDGTGVSALEHILGGAATIRPEQGLFLSKTWRLHPSICRFTSEVFYEGRLEPQDGNENQALEASAGLGEHGLRLVLVEHDGNQNCSTEEAVAVSNIVEQALKSAATWIDRKSDEQSVAPKDILVITPYNAQVFEIQKRLPGVKVGTVDKFQGQEAAVAIYSLATSSSADAPRGMEFLYSLNRLNVATSRGKCVSVLVASPGALQFECRSPRQMQLANAFCRYGELSSN